MALSSPRGEAGAGWGVPGVLTPAPEHSSSTWVEDRVRGEWGMGVSGGALARRGSGFRPAGVGGWLRPLHTIPHTCHGA